MKFCTPKWFSPYSAGERRLMEMIQALATQTGKIMSVISDYAAKQNAFNADISTRLDEVATGITNLNAQINTLQNSSGQVTPEDQATIDGLVSSGAALQAKADALGAAFTPPVPPVTETTPPPADAPPADTTTAVDATTTQPTADPNAPQAA